jgi:alanyl-tRNA synthetase
MGLERLAAILQHVHSNYEIDLFDALLKAAGRETGCTDLANPSLKVIADHIRACSFLVLDGVVPSNEGRGYVQRRIVRRAIRHGYKLGQKKPFFHKLVPDLVTQMGGAYPKLQEQSQRIADILKQEEERFFETLETGMKILDEAISLSDGDGREMPILDGSIAFKLHDTFGFPLDLTQDVARERGITVDVDGFNAAMKLQKDTARAAGKFKMDKALDYNGIVNQFIGYEHLSGESKVVAMYVEGIPVDSLQAGQEGVVVLDSTPFYAESGGQVGDEGTLSTSSVCFTVQDTQKIKADVFGHHGRLQQGELNVGNSVYASVDAEKRSATMRNHSVTHIMHKALRVVLGDHVQQKGSLVNSDRTRFDFTHNTALQAEEIERIEAIVNAEILANSPTSAQLMSMDEAKKTGAMMLFGEKYGEEVRVLSIGSSTELCGGTHVAHTGDIGLFKIVSEGGIAAGVRRVEAITGMQALKLIQTQEQQLAQAAQLLKAPTEEIHARIAQLLEQSKAQEKELAKLKSQIAAVKASALIEQAHSVGTSKIIVAQLDGLDSNSLRETVTHLLGKVGSGIVVLATVSDGKIQMAASVSKDLHSRIKAGDVVNQLAQRVGGKGGGKPDFAMAGGNDVTALPAALRDFQSWLTSTL